MLFYLGNYGFHTANDGIHFVLSRMFVKVKDKLFISVFWCLETLDLC
jgi:hypothetical protein